MSFSKIIEKHKLFKIAGILLFIAYLVYLIYLTFFSQLYGRVFTHRSISFIPLATIIDFLSSSYNHDIIITNIAGNIVAFMPMGFLLPIVFNKLTTVRKVICVMLIATIMIELMQYIAGVGVSDIDDIILNLLGGILGYRVYRLLLNAKDWMVKFHS